MAQRFQKRVTKVIETPWLMATTDDLRWPGTEGGYSGMLRHLMHRYLDTAFALATKYPELEKTFSQVVHLIKPARMLLLPRISLRVLARLLNPF